MNYIQGNENIGINRKNKRATIVGSHAGPRAPPHYSINTADAIVTVQPVAVITGCEMTADL